MPETLPPEWTAVGPVWRRPCGAWHLQVVQEQPGDYWAGVFDGRALLVEVDYAPTLAAAAEAIEGVVRNLALRALAELGPPPNPETNGWRGHPALRWLSVVADQEQ